jgi:serine/threonine-protein kinase mTOR
MTVLRDNKDSLMAVLEAFVYDPLINWRLLQAEEARQMPAVADRTYGSDSLCDQYQTLFRTDPDPERVGRIPKAAYAQGPNRKVKADEREIFNGKCKHDVPPWYI